MRRKINGFTRVAGPKDIPTRVGWVRCDHCGKVIQASGLGIGSHRRACYARIQAARDAAGVKGLWWS